MNEVPWQAVPVGDGRLIDHCDVSYVPTLSMLLELRRLADNVPDGVGVLAMSKPQDSTLALFEGTFAAAREAVPPWGFAVLGSPPMPLELLTSMHERPLDSLLVACHGEFKDEDPFSSFLDLEERLTLSEVLRKDLFSGSTSPAMATSVILGACESGLGRSVVTAEYLGLPMAFLCAPTLYVVCALWQVERLSTAILLGDLLTRRAHGQGVVEAMAASQRALRKMAKAEVMSWVSANVPKQWSKAAMGLMTDAPDPPYAHPYYWAGFIVMGDI